MAVSTNSAPGVARQCDITRTANAMARRARECEHCGATFVQGSLSRKQREAGHVQLYCSQKCYHLTRRKYSSKAESKRAEKQRARVRAGLPPVAPPISRECSVCGSQFETRSERKSTCSTDCRKFDRARRQCSICGAPVGYSGDGMPRRYCSDKCRKSSEPTQRSRRVAKARRRAVERGADAERFDPLEVLVRDGWRCHLCGIDTPRELRGTCDPRAPELDHVVPLSVGGAHTRENTACACRSCNISKGASLATVEG